MQMYVNLKLHPALHQYLRAAVAGSLLPLSNPSSPIALATPCFVCATPALRTTDTCRGFNLSGLGLGKRFWKDAERLEPAML